jgi:hypothetical protein
LKISLFYAWAGVLWICHASPGSLEYLGLGISCKPLSQ